MKKRTNIILLAAVVTALLLITVAVVSAKSILAEAFKEVGSIERAFDVDGVGSVERAEPTRPSAPGPGASRERSLRRRRASR
jgi:hypothetical protein